VISSDAAKKTPLVVRLLALLFLSSLVCGAGLVLSGMWLDGWSHDNCEAPSIVAVCDAAEFWLEYWWLFALPLIGIVTFGAHRVIPR